MNNILLLLKRITLSLISLVLLASVALATFDMIGGGGAEVIAAPSDNKPATLPPQTMNPENYGVAQCISHCGCDANGNPLPSLRDGTCGTEPKTCVVRDCSGASISNPPCRLDVNADEYINDKDINLVKHFLNTNGSAGDFNSVNKRLDTNNDGMVTPQDVHGIINFINSNLSGVKVDECGVCGGSGRNICGFCPGDPNAQQDLGCGCGKAAPGVCGCDTSIQNLGCGCGMPAPSGCDNKCGSNKQIDSCGICGGNNECNSCKYYDMAVWSDGNRIHKTMTRNSYPYWGNDIAQKIGTWKANARVPQCFVDIMNRCGVTWGESRRGSNDDRCMFNNIFALNTPYSGSPAGWRAIGKDIRAELFVVDENCNFVANPDRNQICGGLIARQDDSPLSIVIDESKPNTSTIVNFDINIGSGKGDIYSIWRGSDNLPLVVYDPLNTGNITSAYQLFGNWTFGGKIKEGAGISKVSIRDDNENSTFGTERWSNGYEALAFLDKNNDKEISGDELNGISLWFDKNQNAISEEGEVVSAKEYGITKLMTTPNKVDEKSGDISASLGYQIATQDGLVWGKSIDWMSTGSKSRSELVAKLTNTISLSNKKNPVNTRPLTPEKDKEISAGSIVEEYMPVLGIWRWKLDKTGQEQYATEGSFEFSIDNETLVGQNFVFRPVVNEAGDILTHVEILNMENVQYTQNANEKIVSFEIKTVPGNITKNILRIDHNGKGMNGKTILKYQDSEGKSSEVAYEWQAEKITK